MAETPIHVEAIVLLHQALQDFFRDQPDIFVASDIFWYFKEGKRDKTSRISPDVMVVPGIERRELYERRSFFSWIENKVPVAVFEMASRNTWKKDLGLKKDTYEKLGVKEYYLFDPEFRYLDAPLIAFKLRGKKFRRVSLREPLISELGFRLRVERWMIRLIDDATGEPVPTRAEAAAKSQAEAERMGLLASAEMRRAEILEAEVKRLRAELGRSGP